MEEKVSIVIPVFNGWVYLKEMIDSILAQSYMNWELILVDDHSSENIEQCIQDEYADPRIKYFKRPDQLKKGAQSCRNFGFSKSTGEFVCFFDSDDLISKTCIENRLKQIVHSNVDYCISPAATFTQDIAESQQSKFGYKRNVDTLESFLKASYQHVVWTNIYKREAISDIFWNTDTELFQDFEFCLRCIFKGLKFEFSDYLEPDYFYRISYSKGQISGTKTSASKVKSTISLFNYVHNQIDNLDSKTYYKSCFFLFHLKYLCFFGISKEEIVAQNDFVEFIKHQYGVLTAKKIRFALNGSRLFRIIGKDRAIKKILLSSMFGINLIK